MRGRRMRGLGFGGEGSAWTRRCMHPLRELEKCRLAAAGRGRRNGKDERTGAACGRARRGYGQAGAASVLDMWLHGRHLSTLFSARLRFSTHLSKRAQLFDSSRCISRSGPRQSSNNGISGVQAPRAHGAKMSPRSQSMDAACPPNTEVWNISWKPKLCHRGHLSTYSARPGA